MNQDSCRFESQSELCPKRPEFAKEIARFLYGCIPGPGFACLEQGGTAKAATHQQFLPVFHNPNTDLAQFFNAVFESAIVAGAMLAVLRLGYAGFVYMTTDVWATKGNAKEIIQSAIFGLLLLLSIWLILNQINPDLLNLDIFSGVPRSGSATP